MFTVEDEVSILRRYVTLRGQFGLPRIYNHPHLTRRYRVDGRSYTLGQLARHVDHLEQQARRGRLAPEGRAA